MNLTFMRLKKKHNYSHIWCRKHLLLMTAASFIQTTGSHAFSPTELLSFYHILSQTFQLTALAMTTSSALESSDVPRRDDDFLSDCSRFSKYVDRLQEVRQNRNLIYFAEEMVMVRSYFSAQK